MIVKTVADFKQAVKQNNYPIKQAGAMKAAFMVSPVGFSLDEQTASDNEYMQMDQQTDANLAIVQQMNLARKISDCGIPVMTFPGSPETPADFHSGCAPPLQKRYPLFPGPTCAALAAD